MTQIRLYLALVCKHGAELIGYLCLLYIFSKGVMSVYNEQKLGSELYKALIVNDSSFVKTKNK